MDASSQQVVRDPIRVLIVDDHSLFAEPLANLLSLHEDMEVVGRSPSAKHALRNYRHQRVDVALVDLELPGMDGVAATRELRRAIPGVSVIIVSASKDPVAIALAFQEGASAYVSKTHTAEKLIEAMREAVAGRMSLPPDRLRPVLSELNRLRRKRSKVRYQLSRLTDREMDVLQALARGKSTSEIASALNISTSTVHKHIQKILVKLGVRNRLEAALILLREGRIGVDS
jgi:two-component system nitrate/nitrite response regulator NarL